MNLRPYQSAVIDKARAAAAALDGFPKSVCLVAPTGAGKTYIGAEIARRVVARSKTLLWTAHRAELIDQAVRALMVHGFDVGIISASHGLCRISQVTVASIDTLTARGMKPNADVIICDEAHRAVADEYANFLSQYKSSTIIGLTATPERGDGQGLAPLFRAMVVASSIRELTEQGYLVTCEVIAPREFLRPGRIAQRPVDAYREYASGRSAIVFSPTIKIGREHAQEFRDAGVDAEFIDGAIETKERRAKLESFAAGYYPVIVNCGILTEGTDIPRASCAILARGCGTEGLYLQITGRILRPHESKTDALLLDLRGVSHIHGHPAEDRNYSLHGRAITHGPDTGATYCLVCGAIRTPPDPCAECGAFGDSQKPLKITGDPLVKYASFNRRPQQDLTLSLARFILEARKKGWSQKQPLVKMRALTGKWPTWAQQAEAKKLAKQLADA